MSSAQKPLLIAFLGSIGVGKSFFAKQLAPRIGAVRLNADAARLGMFGSMDALKSQPESYGVENNKKLFGVLDYVTQELLLSGVSVVYDTARYNGADNRRSLKQIADKTDAVLVYVWIETPREIAKARVLNRKETDDQRQLDEEKASQIFVFHDQHFDAPLPGELVVKIDGESDFDKQFDEFTNQLKRLGHDG